MRRDLIGGGDRACSGFFWLSRGKSLERLGGKRCDRNKPGGWMILDTLEGVAGLLVSEPLLRVLSVGSSRRMEEKGG